MPRRYICQNPLWMNLMMINSYRIGGSISIYKVYLLNVESSSDCMPMTFHMPSFPIPHSETSIPESAFPFDTFSTQLPVK